MIRLKSILVATDFSAPSEVALEYGRDLARSFGATLHVLHVADDVIARFGNETYPTLPDVQHDAEERARAALIDVLTDEDRAQLHAKAVVRVSIGTAPSIVDYAKEAQTDLIVMGTHGRGGVAHLLMGSVAERVVRTAPCPVLTVRHPEREFLIPDALVKAAKT
jgi:nucleotide-binding universal stress UspA family protein